MAQSLVPEAKDKLAKFKNQVSSEMGVPFTDYNAVALVVKWLNVWLNNMKKESNLF